MTKHREEKQCDNNTKDSQVKDVQALIDDVADGHKRYEPESRYSEAIQKEIKGESIFLFILLVISLAMLFLSVTGVMNKWFNIEEKYHDACSHYFIYFSSGLLGGVLFGMKNFYRFVAKGLWHQDRKYWRIMSPFIASVIAIVIGSMTDIGFTESNGTQIVGGKVVVGFLAGYFADKAVGKMIDVARVFFGDTKKDDY